MARLKSHSFRKVTAVGFAALLMTVPAERASADLHGLIGGVIVGCGIGVLNCGQKKQKRTTQRQARPRIPATEQGRQTQTALNYFGYNAGVVDGQIGRGTRRAIEGYQATMGYPVNGGDFQPYQYDELMRAYHWAQNGGAAQTGQYGQGLLQAYRQQQYQGHGKAVADNQGGYGVQNQGGYGTQAGYNNQAGFNNQGQRVLEPNINQQGYATNTATVPQATVVTPQQQGQVIEPQQSAEALKIAPLDLSAGLAPASIADRCEIVDLTTQTNQGVILATNMTDPDQALSEKFCEARSFAIGESQGILTQARASEDQIAGTCAQITDAMAPAMSDLATASPQQVADRVAGISQSIGLGDRANAESYGKLCLGLGYRKDDAKMALTGALVMMGAGQVPYAEAVGHHLREGFGVTASRQASLPWYEVAIMALEQNAAAAFEPSKTPERVGVIRAAIEHGSMRAGLGTLPKIIPASNLIVTDN